MKKWSLLFTVMMVALSVSANFKTALPWDKPITVKQGSLVSRVVVTRLPTGVEVELDRVATPYCVYGTVQLKIWTEVRVSKPFEIPARYEWMWVWFSFSAKINAGESVGIVHYDFEPGEDFDYEYQYPTYMDECY